MTALAAVRVVVPSPHQIAFGADFTGGTWTDPATGRRLIAPIVHHLGPAGARQRLDAAADLHEAHHHHTRSFR